MLILDKLRALDRMVYLSDRKANAVPTEFLRSAPLRWSVDAGGRRALAGEVVLRPVTASCASAGVAADAPIDVGCVPDKRELRTKAA